MINITDMANLYISLTGSVTTKLDELYTADKIDAETYAKIIAQSFENAMQLSVTAVQQQAQIDKDIELKNAQISQVLSQATNTTLEGQNIYKQGLLLDSQKDVQLQQKLNLVSENLNIPKQGALLDAQKDDVIKATELKAAQINSANAERAVLANNAAKAGAERALLAQKLITEQDAVSTAASQRSVLEAQALGYAKDADQKAADILMKGFAILANANDFTESTGSQYGVSTTKVKSALDKLNTA